jgi:ubiquinone/menaquinone biosynthesis C-methylase UbiE
MNINESKQKHEKYESLMKYWPGAFDDNNDDTKRHFEMLSSTLPLLKQVKPKNVLTIGDNRGRDAFFIKKNIGSYVVASDLDNSKLLNAVSDGYIDECKVIDVERIDYASESFDIVMAKESFHHWPRPMLGFYEMLRVSKYGVILIEPYDCFYDEVQPYISLNNYRDTYEEVGNYKYQISLREILKSAWSMYLNQVLVRGFNDPYQTPFNFQQWIEKKKLLDQQGDSSLRQFNLMAIFIIKDKSLKFNDGLSGFYKVYTRPLNKFIE